MRPGKEVEMNEPKVAWAPWEEREIPGFGKVFRVEVTAGVAFRARELAALKGLPVEFVLNAALLYGLTNVVLPDRMPADPS